MQVKWDLEHVYFYLVSFIALILIIIGAVNLAQAGIAYIAPVYDDYSPFAQPAPYMELGDWEREFGPELIEEEKARYEAINHENYYQSLLRDTVRGLVFIIVALPIYLYHWRKIPVLEKGR